MAGLDNIALGPRAIDLARSLEVMKEVGGLFEGNEGAGAVLPKGSTVKLVFEPDRAKLAKEKLIAIYDPATTSGTCSHT